MSECKHGLRHGCSYCHATTPAVVRQAAAARTPKKRAKASALSEKMNDKMTALKRRLREIRGE